MHVLVAQQEDAAPLPPGQRSTLIGSLTTVIRQKHFHQANAPFFFLKQKAKNGETLPPAPLARAQRTPQTPSKKPDGGGGEREEAERKALLAVQCSLLKILSKTLATLQHFTPDCCQILLDQVSHAADAPTPDVLTCSN